MARAGAALGFAPLWTMLCRNPLAGVVFAASMPAMVLIAVSRVITGGTADGSIEAERAARDAWSWLMVPDPDGRCLARLDAVHAARTD